LPPQSGYFKEVTKFDQKFSVSLAVTEVEKKGATASKRRFCHFFKRFALSHL